VQNGREKLESVLSQGQRTDHVMSNWSLRPTNVCVDNICQCARVDPSISAQSKRNCRIEKNIHERKSCEKQRRTYGSNVDPFLAHPGVSKRTTNCFVLTETMIMGFTKKYMCYCCSGVENAPPVGKELSLLGSDLWG
jgi:hypothetical protein